MATLSIVIVSLETAEVKSVTKVNKVSIKLINFFSTLFTVKSTFYWG